MPPGLRAGTRFVLTKTSLSFSLPPSSHQRSHLSQAKTLIPARPMGNQGPPPPKRPFCDHCSKPARTCLCSRLDSPPLDNSIGVTILQHSLEKNHPLNSTRIARLGLKNVAVVPVTDVNFRAQFTLSPLDSGESLDLEATKFAVVDDKCIPGKNQSSYSVVAFSTGDMVGKKLEKSDSESIQLSGFDDFGAGNVNCIDGKDSSKPLVLALNTNDTVRKESDFDLERLNSGGEKLDFETTYFAAFDDSGRRDVNCVSAGECVVDKKKKMPTLEEDSGSCLVNTPNDSVTAIFPKYQVSYSSGNLRIIIERTAEPNISWILDCPIGKTLTSKGFAVKKLQRKEVRGTDRFEDFEEFAIAIPPGAALLFPCGKSVIGLEAVNFEVKHLIVLDGTWAKAKRIYHENPWLQLLPHLKLDPMEESLYGDVRHEPKAGCLSTIESIVCALKALGNGMEGMDSLLDLFKSMIGDQIRLKDERFRTRSMTKANI